MAYNFILFFLDRVFLKFAMDKRPKPQWTLDSRSIFHYYSMVTSGVNMRIVLSFICLWIFSLPTYADIVAEGWYKVLSANVHVGYYVSRFEYDSKKREFISKSFFAYLTRLDTLNVI